jgi:hypothetical protein
VRSVAQLPLNSQALDDVDRRRHVFITLPMRLEWDMPADGIQLALEIIDAPAIVGHDMMWFCPLIAAIFYAIAFGSVVGPIGVMQPSFAQASPQALRLHGSAFSGAL